MSDVYRILLQAAPLVLLPSVCFIFDLGCRLLVYGILCFVLDKCCSSLGVVYSMLGRGCFDAVAVRVARPAPRVLFPLVSAMSRSCSLLCHELFFGPPPIHGDETALGRLTTVGPVEWVTRARANVP